MKTQEALRIVVTAVGGNALALRQRMLRIAPAVTESVVCESIEHLREVTRFNDYEAVLLDWRSGGGSPRTGGRTETAGAAGDGSVDSVAAAVKACPMIPLIVVSNEPESKVSENMLRLGAQDYLVKRETNGVQLVRAIHHAIERKRLDIRLKTTLGELGQANARLRSLALRDTLTGALNRRAFFAVGAQMLARARRHDRSMALLYCDLDKFKQINDNLGHAVGDAVLRGFRERCSSVLRRGDSLARLGGDEFVILLEEVDGPDHAMEAARRVRGAFAAPLEVGARRIPLLPSIGVAMFPECETMEALVTGADHAMYVAKRGPGIACHWEVAGIAVEG